MGNKIIINATLHKKPTLTSVGEDIQIQVVCKDKYAVLVCSDKSFLKKLTKAEASAGKEITYNKELNVVVQRFNGMSAEEIKDQLVKEMKKSGGKINGLE